MISKKHNGYGGALEITSQQIFTDAFIVLIVSTDFTKCEYLEDSGRV